MNRIISAVVTASALIFGVFLPREEAVAQTTAKDLAGTWTPETNRSFQSGLFLVSLSQPASEGQSYFHLRANQ